MKIQIEPEARLNFNNIKIHNAGLSMFPLEYVEIDSWHIENADRPYDTIYLIGVIAEVNLRRRPAGKAVRTFLVVRHHEAWIREHFETALQTVALLISENREYYRWTGGAIDLLIREILEK